MLHSFHLHSVLDQVYSPTSCHVHESYKQTLEEHVVNILECRHTGSLGSFPAVSVHTERIALLAQFSCGNEFKLNISKSFKFYKILTHNVDRFASSLQLDGS